MGLARRALLLTLVAIGGIALLAPLAARSAVSVAAEVEDRPDISDGPTVLADRGALAGRQGITTSPRLPRARRGGIRSTAYSGLGTDGGHPVPRGDISARAGPRGPPGCHLLRRLGLGRPRQVRVRRQLGDQYRKRLLRRPAVQLWHVARERRRRLRGVPARGYARGADRSGGTPPCRTRVRSVASLPRQARPS